MNNQFDNPKYSKAVNMAAKKLGISPEKLKNDAESGNIDAILKNMSNEDANKLKNIISDSDATKKFLSSSNIQNFLNSFFNKK